MSKKNRTSVKSLASLASVLETPSATPVSDVPELDPKGTPEFDLGTDNGAEYSDETPSATPDSDGSIRAIPDGEFFPAPAAAPKTPAPRFVTLGVRDSFGFGSDTETSYLLREIRTGKYTRPSLLIAFLARFSDGSEGSVKAKKTSFSVFFSDVKRPIGYYHASRALPVRVEEGTGLLSFDPERTAKVETAIGAGILSDLKGLSPKRTAKKFETVLEKYGVNFDPSEFVPKG